MTDDTGAPTPSSAKRRCDEDASQGSPKRVRVDQPARDLNPLSHSTEVLQDKKKTVKRRDAAGYPKSRHGKEKDDKNVGRRRRGNRPEGNETCTVASETIPQDLSDKAPRLPKRQSAILLGFCGTGCAGMQMSVSCSFVSVHPTLTYTLIASQMRVRLKECYLTPLCESARCHQIMRTIRRKLASRVRLARTQAYMQREILYPSS